jgi:RluA family pseudouridine synthase
VSSELSFIHADELLVAMDKPAGLLTIPGRDLDEPSLWRLAERELGGRLFAVHRLDRETSGVVLFARSPEAHRSLSRAFEQRDVRKEYRALVFPPPGATEGEMRSRMAKGRRGFMRLARPGETAQEAVTGYRVLAVLSSGQAVVALEPLTGRTHQLRFQLAELGSPIVGESHYRQLGGATPLPSERLWLHALSIELMHPGTGRSMKVEASAPPVLRL